jgi:hypothetical protein
MKTTKKERIGVHSLTPSTSGVEGCIGALVWGLGQMINRSIIHTNQTNQTTSWLVCNWNTFDAWTNHWHTQTNKIHHRPDLGEATTFPLIVFSMLGHGGCTQMSFCPKTPKLRISKFLKLGLLPLWRPINFHAYFQLGWSLKENCSFPMTCDTSPTHK